MGTNYYLHINTCEHCGRSDTAIHIGKKSMGWSFGFRAYDANAIDGVSFPITSRKDWLAVMRLNLGVVKNEYGAVVEFPVRWIMEFDAPDADQRSKEDGLTTYYEGPTVTWRDPEGFRFRKGEFC